MAIGITAPLKKEDYLFPTHRGVGEFIGKGMTPKAIWAEYYGRPNGPAKGKGGMNSVGLEFEDGFRMVSSGNALRKVKDDG